MAQSISDDHILKAALDVIAANGYAGATTRQIAAAAGINEVTLFRRFGNKQKLLIAVVAREAEQFGTGGVVYTGDLEADLTRMVAFYQQLMRERSKMIMMLMSEVSRQPELAEVMNHAAANAVRFATIIERYQQEGSLIQEPPMQAFTALLGPLFLATILDKAGHSVSVVPPVNGLSAYVRNYLQGRLLS